MAKQLHLGLFSSVAARGWRKQALGHDIRRKQLYLDTARLAEQAKLDFVLLADSYGVPEAYPGHRVPQLNVGEFFFDPVPVLSQMSAVTSHIGLGATLSTSFYPPYLLARLLSTADHLSDGRFAWNVVTSAWGGAEFGIDLPPHDERYAIADEYLRLCMQLWSSWDADALVRDRDRRIYADAAKVHDVAFQGEYFRSHGTFSVPRSPQGHPVIVMAGTSPSGRDFCARNAEMTIANWQGVEAMKAYSDDMRARLSDVGRDPDSCRLLYSIRPIVGETEAIALEKEAHGRLDVELADGLSYMSRSSGLDLTGYDLDQPLPSGLESTNVKGTVLWEVDQSGRPLTLRELAMAAATHVTFRICGTPEHVADVLAETAREGGGDGFLIRYDLADYNYAVEFLTTVVPVLQRRRLFRSQYRGSTLREHLFAS